MYDLTAKIFLFPALLFLTSVLAPGLIFGSTYQLLLTGAVIAIFGAAGDHLWLNKIKNPLATLLDLGLTAVLTWGTNFIWSETLVTIVGAGIFALVVAVFEYFTHNLLLHNHR